MGNIPRRRFVPPKRGVPTIVLDTVYTEDVNDPHYILPVLRRTEGPLTALSKRQQAEYWKTHGAA